MASYATLTLDTTAPSGVSLVIEGGAAFATQRDVNVAAATTDGTTTGYQMKIWGDVDPAANASIQPLEGNSSWISYSAGATAVRLSTGDGVKTLNLRVRDDVGNESTVASDSITLDTSVITVNITSGPTPTRISKVASFNSSQIVWSTDDVFEEYKVKVVPSTSSDHTTGTALGTVNGSTNVAGAVGGYAAATSITTTINGTDLEAASAGDGAKIVKVFVRDSAGNWSL